MGGHITLQFMARSPLAARVSGVILEAPVLDWNATLVYRSRVLGVPGIATWCGKTLAAMRAGLDWSQLDFVADHHGITAPILLFHGVHDQYVPEAASSPVRCHVMSRSCPSSRPTMSKPGMRIRCAMPRS
jgi:alpha-beta hydrolase superfamily lysophospholipase